MTKTISFIVVGVVGTLVDFVIFTGLKATWFPRLEQTWLATIGAGVVATGVNYILHSRITWKDRKTTKWTMVHFLAWNAGAVLGVRPILTGIFQQLGGLYELAFAITTFLGIPFNFDFVRNTGIYALMTLVTLIINFWGYEKVVFGDKRVRDARK